MLKTIKKSLNPIDYFLDRITMYRLVLYYLILLLAVAEVFGFFGLIHYQPMSLLFSTVFILAVCYIANKFFAYMFDVPANVESVYITALILALIISPLKGLGDNAFFALASWASIWAIASKFIFAIRKKHIFNPAAFGVAVTAIFIGLSATWWVGTGIMVPFVLIGGLLMVRKIRRFDLVLSFFIAALVMILGYNAIVGYGVIASIKNIILDTPIFFFAFVMFTEPMTTPPTRPLRIWYGIVTGVLYAPFIHVGEIFSTPELALLIGNIFSYIVSPKYKMVLALEQKKEVARDTYEFIFKRDKDIKFRAGQYLEWTLPGANPDNRGVRRFFTISSSPTEDTINMGVKFYPNPSTFKTTLKNMQAGQVIVASQLSGDFTLPKDKSKKLVFIAGGIGITPFRSMIKYLIDVGEKRDITLFYSNREIADIAYEDIFKEAYQKLGIKTLYTLTERDKVPANWPGSVGFFDANSIKAGVPDYMECIFFLSGPQSLVVAFEDTLSNMGIQKSHIKKDYFPGFA